MIVSNGPVVGHRTGLCHTGKGCCATLARILAMTAAVLNIVWGIILLVLLSRSSYYNNNGYDDYPDNGTRVGFRGNNNWLYFGAAYLIFVGVVILSIELPCVWALRCMPCFQNYICRGITYILGCLVGFITSYGWIASIFFFLSGCFYVAAGCLGASGAIASY